MMLPNPWSYSSIVRILTSLLGSGRFENIGATFENAKGFMSMVLIDAGTGYCFPSVYFSRAFLNSQYFGVGAPCSLIGAS